MADQQAQTVWGSIIKTLEETLQYGFLKQIESVVDVKLEGSELSLFVSDDEAYDFFSAEVNKQRLIIISRPIPSP